MNYFGPRLTCYTYDFRLIVSAGGQHSAQGERTLFRLNNKNSGSNNNRIGHVNLVCVT